MWLEEAQDYNLDSLLPGRSSVFIDEKKYSISVLLFSIILEGLATQQSRNIEQEEIKFS